MMIDLGPSIPFVSGHVPICLCTDFVCVKREIMPENYIQLSTLHFLQVLSGSQCHCESYVALLYAKNISEPHNFVLPKIFANILLLDAMKHCIPYCFRHSMQFLLCSKDLPKIRG